ncbi:MAG: dephospho-CoA kinase [Planctomycetota bacterium]|jgi:dephospho-CoA kinase
MSPITVIGLVGGIASGKSSVARLIVLARPAVRRALARRIPGAVDRGEGKVNRTKLAQRVFESPRALRVLEEITHPPIRRAIRQAIRRARRPLVLLDAALLQERGAQELCDLVVYVACPARVRRARSKRDRGWNEKEHRAREAQQWSCRRKRAHADMVVDNSGDPARTRRDVERILRRIERST